MNRLIAAETFVVVVEEGGFTAAARRLGITKSYASKLVTQLEDRLGVRLLHRTTRKVSVTEAGQAYYERCTELMRAMEDAEAEAGALQTTARGRLRISLPAAFGATHLAQSVIAFQALHPGLSLELSLSERHVDLVAEGFDVAIRIGDVRDTTLVARRLLTGDRVLCASPAYLARKGAPQTPQELTQHHCLRYSHHQNPSAWRLFGPPGEVLVPVAGPVLVDHPALLLEAGRQGLGIFFAPLLYSAPLLQEGLVQRVLPDWGAPAVVHAVFPTARHLPAKVRLFVDHMVACCLSAGAPERSWAR